MSPNIYVPREVRSTSIVGEEEVVMVVEGAAKRSVVGVGVVVACLLRDGRLLLLLQKQIEPL